MSFYHIFWNKNNGRAFIRFPFTFDIINENNEEVLKKNHKS